ncbi:MAG: glucokinase [Verrucomicrobiota bacterium]
MTSCIGIDLGGSSIKGVAVTRQGETLAQLKQGFDATVRMNWAEQIRALLDQLTRGLAVKPVATGISAPGLADPEGRTIAVMPGRLSGLEGLDWTAFLEATLPVPVLNDAHAALVGEAWLGAAKGFQNALLLTLGTGVGGAAMVDGRLLRGHLGRAGHFGHLCLDIDGAPDVCRLPGSLEGAIGNCTVAERSGGRFESTHDLVAAHAAGDVEASRIWLRSVRALACAIASLVNILDPEAVIVGGGIARAGRALFEPLAQFVNAVEWQPAGYRVRLLPATLGEFAGAYGAAWQARSTSGALG